MIDFSDEQRRALLAWRHRLVPSARCNDPVEIADSLVALHSSDPVSVLLACFARLREPSVASVEASLYEKRQLLRHHAMRRTLWVMRPRVAALAHIACTEKIAAKERRRTVSFLEGDEAWLEAAMADIVQLISSVGPLNARQVGEMLPHTTRKLVIARGKRYETNLPAHTKILQLAGFEGTLCRTRPQGSWIGSHYAWVRMCDWIGCDLDDFDDVTGIGEAETQARLAALWLRRFGPATLLDLQWWTGWTKTATRRALKTIGAVSVELESGEGVWLRDDTVTAAEDRLADTYPGPWVALLGGLDPTPMGWKQRDWYLDKDVESRVTDRFGNIGPTVWADGRVVGGWAQRRDGTIATAMLRPLSKRHQELLEFEIHRLRQAIGTARFRPRFPPRNQKDLLR